MKIAIVNDTTTAAESLRRVIAQAAEHQVAWIARDGVEAVRLCAQNRPDLILMDLILPVMDGIEATRIIMRDTPCAIMVVTASLHDNTDLVFRAMGAGALDVTDTPVLAGAHGAGAALLAKIATIGRLIQAPPPSRGESRRKTSATQVTAASAPTTVDTLVAMGASTGGPPALAALLSGWREAPGTAIVIVQHIDHTFGDSFVKWLANQTALPVNAIEHGDSLRPGEVFVAKSNDHLRLDRQLRLCYDAVPLDYPYRPSVDVFFRSVAQYWKNDAIGILLTGMGHDGAAGLLELRRAGMLTVAQDQASCTVYGMPRAAAQIDAAEFILPLDEIGPLLHNRKKRKHVGN